MLVGLNVAARGADVNIQRNRNFDEGGIVGEQLAPALAGEVPGHAETWRQVVPEVIELDIGAASVVVGLFIVPTSAEIDLPSWLLDDVALLPVNMIRQERRAREIAGELAERLSAGELRVAVERFGIADAARALDALKSGSVRGRAVVIPGI